MNKLNFFSAFLVIVLSVIYIGCGDDTTTNNNGGNNSTPPNIQLKQGAFYTFNIDSIQTNGNVTGTRFKASNTYLAPITFQGKSNVFPIRIETKDSTIPVPLAVDTYYVCYEGGKFYQYGVLQLVSPSFPATWDVVGDFTVALGNQWIIGQNVPFTIGVISGTANITGKIAVDTTFKTQFYGERDVNAYRSEIVAELFVSTFSIGKIYVDYFIGDSDPATNPAGLVRLRLRPINVTAYTAAGFDQKIQTWIIP
jgi:hypothetical protein